jgi:hypothetical protein
MASRHQVLHECARGKRELIGFAKAHHEPAFGPGFGQRDDSQPIAGALPFDQFPRYQADGQACAHHAQRGLEVADDDAMDQRAPDLCGGTRWSPPSTIPPCARR